MIFLLLKSECNELNIDRIDKKGKIFFIYPIKVACFREMFLYVKIIVP